MSSASSSSAPFPSPVEYFARLLSARTALPRSMSAIYPSCAGPTAGITKSAQTPPCTPPCLEKNPRPLKGSSSKSVMERRASRPSRRAGTPGTPPASSITRSETPPNPKRNHHHRFERHRFPGSHCRNEFPPGQSFRRKRIQTFVRAIEDANVTHLPIGVNDRIERDHTVHVGANQFQRIAGVRFFRGDRRQQFAFFPSRIEFRKPDHPAAGRGIQIRHIQRHLVEALAAKYLAVNVGDFIVGNRRRSPSTRPSSRRRTQ